LKVSIVIGSKTDLDLAKAAAEVLDGFEVENSINVLSAHRMPEVLQDHIQAELASSTKVFIGIAGMAAHLAGNIAAHTSVPVIGVPGDGGPLNGFDALLSTVQMPKGVPVATVAIGKAGAINAGHLAAQMLAISDDKLEKAIKDARIQQKLQLKKENDELQAT
tara:strand:+ start:138 stop:626 length:489 start_codon:yes stop_codon:yes gene_type:complete